MTTVISANGLQRVFPGNPPVRALTNATLHVEQGERVAIVGPSGSGKSTLLNLLGLLDRPTAGTYTLLGRETTSLRAREADRLRARSVGFVFQAYHVLPRRTVRENLELKLAIARIPRHLREARAADALDAVNLSILGEATTQNLSGGEKQRLAIARAMLTSPAAILADEPTGNLDQDNASAVLSSFEQLSQRGMAIVIITHDPRSAAWADRRYRLERGTLTEMA